LRTRWASRSMNKRYSSPDQTCRREWSPGQAVNGSRQPFIPTPKCQPSRPASQREPRQHSRGRRRRQCVLFALFTGVAVLSGPDRCLGAVADPDLAQYRLHVDLEGCLSDVVPARDRPVGKSFDKTVKDLDFAWTAWKFLPPPRAPARYMSSDRKYAPRLPDAPKAVA